MKREMQSESRGRSLTVLRAVPLDPTHDVDGFECGVAPLDIYLVRHALSDQSSAKIRTYALVEDARVIAYYSVTVGAIEGALSRAAIACRERRRVIPVVVLTRLAVDLERQRQGIGEILVRQVEREGLGGASVVSARAVVTTATGDDARCFFMRQSFEPLPGDPYRLHLPLRPGRNGV